MKKKLIAAGILTAFAAVILTGCHRNTNVPEFSFSKPVSMSQAESNEENSPEESSADNNSSENSSEESSSAESGSSDKENSENSDIPQENENRTEIILDPLNERTIICEDNKITLTGKIGENFTPTVSFPHTKTLEKNGDYFTFTAEISKNVTGYGTISIFENATLRLYAENGKISVVDIPEVEEINEKAVKNAIEQPLNQVSEYIAINADKAKIAEVLGKITEISDKICEGLTDDYDKLRAISQWVSANIYYDYAAYNAGVPAETLTLEYMLKNASSVCGGYSNMTSALAAAQGITVYNVHGGAVTGGKTFAEADPAYHEWNYAVIGGRVVWVDSGWNSYCYRYENGRYVKGEIGVKYFDISGAALAQNHKAKYAEYRDYFALLED